MVDEPKAVLQRYLQRSRDVLLWKLDGLSEYDIRRPMTATGTNLLGLVKHVTGIEAGYLGETFGRRFPEPIPWFDDEDAAPNVDMFATPDESRDQLIALYRQVWAHSDATIAALPLDALGHVPWWPPERAHPSLQTVLVHMIAEAERHAGHADIIRELIDGRAGIRPDNANLPEGDTAWWSDYRARVEAAAKQASEIRPA